MGTVVTIEVVQSGTDAEAAMDRAFGWFSEIEARCTRFDEQSDKLTWGGDPRRCAHQNENMSCIACHSSWNQACFGCTTRP